MSRDIKTWTPESAAAAVAACVRKDDRGNTWYSARVFMDVIGYSTWQKFTPAIERAQYLCVKSRLRVDDHFRRTFQDIGRGDHGGVQFQADVEMSREGFNRLIQSIDPRKPIASEIKNAIAGVLSAIQDERLIPATDLSYRPDLPWSQRFKLYHKDHYSFMRLNLPDYFSVSSHNVDFLFLLEDEAYRHFLPIDTTDLPDGSIGIRWAQQRREWRKQSLDYPDYHRTAPMRVPCRARPVQVNVYHMREFQTYQDWLYNVYVPIYLPKYVTGKPEFREAHPCAKLSVCHNVARIVSKVPLQVEPRYQPDLIRVQRGGGFIPNDGRPLPLLPGEQMSFHFGEIKQR